MGEEDEEGNGDTSVGGREEEEYAPENRGEEFYG
jgi:hypothetical protein